MTSIRKISEVLGNVQESTVNHQKYLIILKKVYEKHKFDDFVAEFVRCIKHFLFEDILKNQNHFADNGLEFCAMFSTSLKKDNTEQFICPFLKSIILKVLEVRFVLCHVICKLLLLLQLHNVSQARYRVCLHINQLLQQVNKKDGHIDAEIYENIKEVMLERMQDVKSTVQIQAIEILGSLQDSENPNDPIINAYMKCLCDRNAQVRKTIIRCIGLNANTIPVLIKRCFDIDESVRRSAFEKLSELPIHVLKIEQRQYILENGLKDKSEKVQSFIQKTLLSRWLSSYDGNYFQLICALKLDADERDWKQSVKIVENILNIFFRSGDLKNMLEMLPLGSDKLITANEEKWEQLIYWRCLSSFLQQNENTIDYLEDILPELSSFCKYIQRVDKRRYTCTNEFDILLHGQIMYELLKIIEMFDFSDEMGRINLHKLIKDMLTEAELSYDNVSLMVKILEQLYPSTEERTAEVIDIISEIRNPLVKQQLPDYIIRHQKIAKFRVELNIAVDKQEQVIEKGDFKSAEELQRKIDEIKTKIKWMNEEHREFREVRIAKNDIRTSLKCLNILIALLSSSTIKTLPAAIKTLQDEFVQPLLISPLPEIYLKAMHLYGLVCIVDKTMAQMSVGFFCEPLLSYKYMAIHDEQRILLAISCITDLLLLHGRNILEPDGRNKPGLNCSTSETDLSVPICMTSIIEVFSKMLDDTSPKIRERSCEAIVKLMLRGVISSPILLSKLILKWFNPATAKDVRSRQLLGCLFIEYVTEVPGSLKIVEDSFIPTLTSVVEAPRYSPLASVSIDSTLKFLIELSRPGRNKCNKKLNPHINISLLLCREICNKPNNNCALIYLKALVMLDTPTNDEIVLGQIRKYIDSMFKLIKDKTLLIYVRKYKNKLESDMEQTISTIDPKTANTSVMSKSMESNLNEYSAKKPKQTVKNGKYNNSKNNGHNGTVRGSGHENDRCQTVNSLDRTSVSACNNVASSQIASLETEHTELENNVNCTLQTEKSIK
ncbi:Chromosome associated protein G [Carabus blaptoides fortunei]